MAVISVSSDEPGDIWKVSNWALRELFARARIDRRIDPAAATAMDRAEAYSGLHLEQLDQEAASRLATILRTAALSLAADLVTTPRDHRDVELATALRELDSLLGRAYSGPI